MSPLGTHESRMTTVQMKADCVVACRSLQLSLTVVSPGSLVSERRGRVLGVHGEH